MITNNLEWLPDDFVCSPKWFLDILEGLCGVCKSGKYIDGHGMRRIADKCKEHVMLMVMKNVPKIDFDSIMAADAGFDDLLADFMEEQE